MTTFHSINWTTCTKSSWHITVEDRVLRHNSSNCQWISPNLARISNKYNSHPYLKWLIIKTWSLSIFQNWKKLSKKGKDLKVLKTQIPTVLHAQSKLKFYSLKLISWVKSKDLFKAAKLGTETIWHSKTHQKRTFKSWLVAMKSKKKTDQNLWTFWQIFHQMIKV
jgi:hypothetical protein